MNVKNTYDLNATRKANVRIKTIFLLAIILGIFFIFVGFQEQFFNLAKEIFNKLIVFYESRPVLFIIVFLILHTAVVASFIPLGIIFNLLAGAIFDVKLGAFLISLSNTTGALINFTIARHFIAEKIAVIYPYEMARIGSGIDRVGWIYLIFLRLLPLLPGQIVSLIVGILPFRMITFTVVTFIFGFPLITLYTFVGTKLSSISHLEDVFEKIKEFLF